MGLQGPIEARKERSLGHRGIATIAWQAKLPTLDMIKEVEIEI